MCYVILIFILGAGVSALVLITATIWGRARRFTTVMRRSLVMLATFGGLAIVLHISMLQLHWFLGTLPAELLRLDARSGFYGRIAVAELHRRARAEQLTVKQMQAISETLLAHPWWLDSDQRFDPIDPIDAWFHTVCASTVLSGRHYASWFELAPPPIFSTIARVPAGVSIPVRVSYGRDWEYSYNTPYQVDRFQIGEAKLNGAVTDFEVVEAPGSEAKLGRFANRVQFELWGIEAPDEPGEWRLELTYFVDLEPGGYKNIGPLAWSVSGEVVEANEPEADAGRGDDDGGNGARPSK